MRSREGILHTRNSRPNRLPKDGLAKELEAVQKAGVKLCSTRASAKYSALQDAQKQNDAVFIAVGAQKIFRWIFWKKTE